MIAWVLPGFSIWLLGCCYAFARVSCAVVRVLLGCSEWLLGCSVLFLGVFFLSGVKRVSVIFWSICLPCSSFNMCLWDVLTFSLVHQVKMVHLIQ